MRRREKKKKQEEELKEEGQVWRGQGGEKIVREEGRS